MFRYLQFLKMFMRNRGVFFVFVIFLVLVSCLNQSYAAFPVVHKDATTTAWVSTPRTFGERRLPQYVSHLRHSMFPGNVAHHHVEKTGWPGIVSISCGVGALASIFVFGGLFFPLAICAIVFGAIGVSKRKHTNTGLALAGLLLGSILIVLFVTLVALIVAAYK